MINMMAIRLAKNLTDMLTNPIIGERGWRSSYELAAFLKVSAGQSQHS